MSENKKIKMIPISIRVPKDLSQKINKLAQAESRSLTGQIVYILKEHLK